MQNQRLPMCVGFKMSFKSTNNQEPIQCTIASYNARVLKFTTRLIAQRVFRIKITFLRWKNALTYYIQRWRCSCKFNSRRPRLELSKATWLPLRSILLTVHFRKCRLCGVRRNVCFCKWPLCSVLLQPTLGWHIKRGSNRSADSYHFHMPVKIFDRIEINLWNTSDALSLKKDWLQTWASVRVKPIRSSWIRWNVDTG
jgi:hypothetical protein